ncbi:MAG: patatin-like phospholipase family protein [Candidatus Omnitrophica bacterium]|nr:patatin-like phospholipase family protein [Candidatus Omnitrophota bacterium]
MQEVTGLVNKNGILKQIPLFSNLNWFEIWILLPKLRFFEYSKNEIIYEEGSEAEGFYLLISGRLQVSKRVSSHEERTIDSLTRNKIFGILSLLTGEPHSASVRVVNDAFILKINKDDFNQILDKIPKLAVYMSRSLSQRVRRLRLHPKDVFETKVISIVSPANQVGKSLYATNLSFSLAKETREKPLLIEINSQYDPILQKINSCEKVKTLNIAEAIPEKGKINNFIVSDPNNIDILSLDYDPDDSEKQASVIRIIGMLMDSYKYIIIDIAKKMDFISYEILKQSDIIHIVSAEEASGLNAAKVLLNKIRKYSDDMTASISVILSESKFKKQRLSGSKRRKIIGERIYATLPFLEVPQSDSKIFWQVIEYPESEYALTVRRISRDIAELFIGLSLGGGAALGFAHVGVLKVFEEEGIKVDIIAGTSMGAVIGALWASGVTAKEIEEVILSFENKFNSLKLFDMTFPRRGLISGKYINRLIRKHLKSKIFEELKIPFLTVSSNLESRQEVIIDEGDIVKAVRASIAIPGVFTPMLIDKDFLIDGGILQPLPVRPLIHKGVRKIIAVNVLPNQLDVGNAFSKYRKKQEEEISRLKISGILGRMGFFIRRQTRRFFFPNLFDSIVIAMQTSESIIAEESSKLADVCLHPDLSDVSWFEFYRVRELIKRGEDETRKKLPMIRQIIDSSS